MEHRAAKFGFATHAAPMPVPGVALFVRYTPFTRAICESPTDSTGAHLDTSTKLAVDSLSPRRRSGEGSGRGEILLSWTPWYSPWGGHEFSPFHYLGARFGYSFYTRILKKPSQHVPYQNLFPTYIGRTLRRIRNESNLRIVQIAPRYYPECSFLMHIPIVREFLAWNCAMLIKRRS